MNKLFAALKRAPKRSSAILAMIAAAVIVPAALFAWGPDRPTFTMAQPASYVTFNSITDNPMQGDERNFVQIKDVTAGGQFVENVNLVPGHEYQVYSFYHNNASSSLNDAAHNYKGIAKDAQMRIQMPATVQSNQSAQISGVVSASNANPVQVWDEAYGKATSGDVVLRYVQNSATIHNNGATNGQKLPNELLTTGTNLGYNTLDGTLPGCNQYSGYVTFNFTVGQPNFEVTKQVAPMGSNAFAKSATVKPGDEVQYKIQYKNTGTTDQENVVIRDQLPAGVTYVAGTTQMASSATNGQYAAVSDNVTKDGINIGYYAANGGNAYVKFTAKVADNSQLDKCGVNTLINTAFAQTPNGTKSDTANVVVSKDCTPPPVTPVYTCDALAVHKISETDYKFDGQATAKNGASIVNYTFDFGDGTTKTVTNPLDVAHTYTKSGNYNVAMSVTFTVSGVQKTITSDNCKAKVCITIPVVTPVYTCDALAVHKISETEYSFDGQATAKDGATIVSYTFNFGDGTTKTVTSPADVAHTYTKSGNYTVSMSVTFNVNGVEKTTTSNSCKATVCVTIPPVTITVCDLTTKKVVTINEKDFDAKKYSKNLDDCKPPVMIKVCDLTSKKIVTIDEKNFDASKYSKDLNDCKPPVMINVCELATKKIVSIDEKNFDANKYSKNLADCAVVNKIQVCDLTTKKVISIDEKDFDSAKYSKNLDDCKPPVMISVCELDTKKIVSIDEKNFDASKYSKDLNDCKTVTIEMCTVPGKENLPRDSADCVVTPPVTELPHTGMSDNILTIAGAGSLIAALGYYVASRKALGQ